MPVLGISDTIVSDAGYRSGFKKENETASVGTYSVLLDNTGIEVELTSHKCTAVHRYTYPGKAEAPYVVLDATASIMRGDVKEAEVDVDVAQQEISGYLLQKGGLSGRYGGLPTYFVVRFSEPFEDYGTFEDDRLQPGSTHVEGSDVGAYAGFASKSGAGQVVAVVAVSFISTEQARANLEEEVPHFDFEAVVATNRDAWQEKLGKIEITGGTETERRIFYTALYNVYMMPTLFTEAGGVYMGFDGEPHTAEGFTYFTDLSLWDTFRTLHPLMALVDTERARDFVISLIKMYEQGGDLPKWPMGKGYTGTMIGTHADSVIAEAYIKGVNDFDAETAYEGMRRHATQPVPNAGRSDMEHYTTLGYCTTDNTSKAPSKTLEYVYDDYCVGVMARELGYEADADMFFQRARNYAHLWDPKTRFFRGKDSAGNWFQPFSPRWPFAEEYVEGDAWHYLWFVPHDVPGLMDLFGGTEPYIAKLTAFFQEASVRPDTFLPDVYYWHGNEPDIHSVYMFNEAGRPDLCAKWVRWIMETKYRDAPDGIDGNDDGGTLSSWYVFSSLGFFPMNPCDGRYMIGSPLFEEAVLHLPGGDLVVRTANNEGENIYVQSASLNGLDSMSPSPARVISRGAAAHTSRSSTTPAGVVAGRVR